MRREEKKERRAERRKKKEKERRGNRVKAKASESGRGTQPERKSR